MGETAEVKIRLTLRKLLRSDFARAVIIHVGLFTFVTSVVDGWQLKTLIGLVLFSLVPVTTILVRWVRSQAQLPDGVGRDLSPLPKHFCRVPATAVSINGARKLAERQFGPASISYPNLIAMYEVNGHSLIALECNGIVVAYADFFILRPNYLEQLIAGKLKESEMKADMTAPLTDFANVGSLYLAGIVVKEPHQSHGGRRAAILLWVACKLLLEEYFLEVDSIMLYAEGFSDEGITLLVDDLAFECMDDSPNRASGYPLYCRKLTRDDVQDWLESHADWSRVCTLELH